MLNEAALNSSRFHLDNAEQFGFVPSTSNFNETSIHARFLARHVQVSQSLFPKIAKSIERATRWLLGKREVHAFVSADSDLNASCTPGPSDLPLIWLSSGLVKSLKESELVFVIGHELGHWYYRHYLYPTVAPDSGPLFVARQQLSRAAEISADRFGLLACGNVDVALRAILKTASGLPEEHIGARVSEFISQARNLKIGEINQGEVFAAHPPMVIRARALLWFSMSKEYMQVSNLADEGAIQIDVVNSRVEKDLLSVLGTGFSLQQDREIQDAILWMALYEMMVDGKLAKKEQSLIDSEFGQVVLEKVKALVRGKSTSQVVSEIRDRALEAKSLIAAYPKSQVDILLKQKKDVSKYVNLFLSRLDRA